MSTSKAKPEHNSEQSFESNPEPKLDNNQPLPCRGCSESCPNKLHCNGKPWRQAATNIKI